MKYQNTTREKNIKLNKHKRNTKETIKSTKQNTTKQHKTKQKHTLKKKIEQDTNILLLSTFNSRNQGQPASLVK